VYFIQIVCYSFILPMEKEAILKQLGERIKAIRKEKGYTQTHLAHKIGKDQQVIQRLEKGDFNPTYFFLYQVAQGLEVNLHELFR